MTGSEHPAHLGHDGDLSGLVAQIAQNAKLMREEADKLTAKIKAFEALISKLPGKAACEVIIGGEDGDVQEFLAVQRNGNTWDLVVYEQDYRTDYRTSSTLLRDASVVTKIVAVHHFEPLLVAMANALLKLATDAREAAEKVDTLTSRLQVKGGA